MPRSRNRHRATTWWDRWRAVVVAAGFALVVFYVIAGWVWWWLITAHP